MIMIKADGNVGIGTTTPASQLEISHPTFTRSKFTYAGNDKGLTIGNWANEAYIYNELNTDLVFGTNDLARVRITNDGNVGIGTSSPNATLQIGNNVGDGSMDLYSEYQAILFDGGTPINSYGVGIRPNTFVFNSRPD